MGRLSGLRGLRGGALGGLGGLSTRHGDVRLVSPSRRAGGGDMERGLEREEKAGLRGGLRIDTTITGGDVEKGDTGRVGNREKGVFGWVIGRLWR